MTGRAAVAIAVALASFAWPVAPSPARGADERLDCVKARTESRYRNYGYEHLVHLESQCRQKAACDVSTSANPEKTRVTLRPAEKRTLMTHRGSPAREFEAIVECTAAG